MDTAHDHKVCCFCGNDIAIEEYVCYTCHEYKGIMTVEAYEDYLKVTHDCDCLSDPHDKVIA